MLPPPDELRPTKRDHEGRPQRIGGRKNVGCTGVRGRSDAVTGRHALHAMSHMYAEGDCCCRGCIVKTGRSLLTHSPVDVRARGSSSGADLLLTCSTLKAKFACGHEKVQAL